MSQGWSDWRARLRWCWKITFLGVRRTLRVSGSPDHTRAASWKEEKEREKENRREMTKETEELSLAKNKQKILKCGRKRTLLGGNDGFQKGGFRLVVPTTLLSTTSWSATWTSARNCTPMSCCQVARPNSKGLVHDEKMTAWLHPQWRSRCFLRQTESTQCRLEDRSCLPSAECGSRRASTMDLARPSPTGRASELNICCIWEQQFCMEIDSISKITEFSRDVFQCLSSAILNCLYICIYFSFVLLDIAAMWWLLCFIVSKKKRRRQGLFPEQRQGWVPKRKKARKKLILHPDFQPLKHLKKNEQAMLGNLMTDWSSSQCLDDSWTQAAGWKSARAHIVWMAVFSLNLAYHPTHVVLDLGCTRSIGTHGELWHYNGILPL